MNTSPSFKASHPGEYTFVCSRCGATNTDRTTCQSCGELLVRHEAPRERKLPFRFIYAALNRPRIIALKSFKCNSRVVIGLCMILFSLILLTTYGRLILRNYQTNEMLLREGQVTYAEVTVREETNGSGYYISYQYSALVDGKETIFTQRQAVHDFTFNGMLTGDRVPVVFLPSHPDVAKLMATITSGNILLMLIFLFADLPILVVGGYILIDGVKEIIHQRHKGRDREAEAFSSFLKNRME